MCIHVFPPLADINECELQDPCLHGGTCVDMVNGYECQCTAEWEGPQCQLDADECRGSPCRNALRCRNLVGDYECVCQPGWTGKNCDSSEFYCKCRRSMCSRTNMVIYP